METLFDRPLARRTDPSTSYEAADELVQTGELARQEQEVYKALKMFPGFTSKMIAHLSGLDRYLVARRLPGLREKGKAKNCPEKCLKLCFTNRLCPKAEEHKVKPPHDRPAIIWWPR